MSKLDYNTSSKKDKHLNYEERLKIEVSSRAGLKPKKICWLLGGRSERTIYRELKQGD